MSDQIGAINAAVGVSAPVGTNASSATNSPNPANAGAAAAELDTTQAVSNMSQLKDIAPDVYNKMMQGIATNICSDMKSHQDRIKKIMRKNRQQE